VVIHTRKLTDWSKPLPLTKTFRTHYVIRCECGWYPISTLYEQPLLQSVTETHRQACHGIMATTDRFAQCARCSWGIEIGDARWGLLVLARIGEAMQKALDP
jgi:hypothetical protein